MRPGEAGCRPRRTGTGIPVVRAQEGGAGNSAESQQAEQHQRRIYSVYARLKTQRPAGRVSAATTLLPVCHAALNLLAVSGSFYLAYLMDRAGWFNPLRMYRGERPMLPYIALSVGLGAMTVALSAFGGAYRRYDTLMNIGAKTKLLASFFIVTIATFVVDLFGRIDISRLIYAAGALLAVPALVASSNLYARLMRWCHMRGLGVRRVAVLGVNELGRMVARKLFQQPGIGYVPVGFIADETDKAEGRVGPVVGDGPELPVLGTKQDVASIVSRHGVQEIIVAEPQMSNARGA